MRSICSGNATRATHALWAIHVQCVLARFCLQGRLPLTAWGNSSRYRSWQPQQHHAAKPPQTDNAAFAVWEYARASAVVLFGDALGDPIAGRILRALRAEQGMDRTQIRDLFSRHAKADSIDLALALLREKGLAAMQKLDTEGRSIEFWTATKAT